MKSGTKRKAAPSSCNKRPVGRPPTVSLDDPAVVDALCERVICGDNLQEICADETMPAERTVYIRMSKDEEFRSRIAHAREAQQEVEADRIVAMADAATPEDWQVVKLRIWARQWRASKLAPRKFGNRITQELTGPDGADLNLSDHEAGAKLAALLEAVKLRAQL